MADFETHPAGTRDRIAVMEARCELWWGMLNDRAGLIREYKARAERAEAALGEARSDVIKLATLLGCDPWSCGFIEWRERVKAVLANLATMKGGE